MLYRPRQPLPPRREAEERGLWRDAFVYGVMIATVAWGIAFAIVLPVIITTTCK